MSPRRFVASLIATAAIELGATAGISRRPTRRADVHRGAQCTSNFVFADGAGVKYLGQAAHCSGTGAATDTNGCDAGSLPLGTAVEIDGATRPGTLAYSSWLTMQGAGETDADTCQYNDFALVRLDPADAGSANPSVPFWGGPTGTAHDGHGNRREGPQLRQLVTARGRHDAQPEGGRGLGSEAGGWNHPVYTVTPGVPGDSGSGSSTGRDAPSARSARSRSRRCRPPTASAT